MTLDNLVQTPQGLSLASNLDSGSHSVSLSHMVKILEWRFPSTFLLITYQPAKTLAVFTLNGASTTLQVRGTNDETELYDSPVNTDVTMIAHSADAATAIKRGRCWSHTSHHKDGKLGKPIQCSNKNNHSRGCHKAVTQGAKMDKLGKMQSMRWKNNLAMKMTMRRTSYLRCESKWQCSICNRPLTK